jgi:flavorubredoxin
LPYTPPGKNGKEASMAKAVVLYTTRTNETGKLAELIAEGMKAEGMDVMVAKVTEIEKKGIKPDDYDAIVLGSPTYNGEMLPAMKTFLFSLEKANVGEKAGGAFGAFGWSGEAPKRIYDTMKNIFKMNMVDKPLRVKSASERGAAVEAKNYGRQVAKKMS